MLPLTLPRNRPTGSARWVLPVALPILAVFATHAAIAPERTGSVLRSIGTAATWGAVLIAGLVLTVLAALAVTALRSKTGRARALASSPATWIAVAVVAYFILLTSVAGRITPLPFFDAFERHWQGKVLDLIWIAILFAMFRRWAKAEAGLRWRLRSGSAAPAWIAIGAVFVLFTALTALAVATDPSASTPVGFEQIAFNATIPNLTEELIWRAAMLAVLDRVFGTPRSVLGAKVGWGAVVTAVVFGLGHAILLDQSGAWSVNVAGGVFALVMGLALAWIWARTGSVWPAFLLHCAPELGVDAGMLIV